MQWAGRRRTNTDALQSESESGLNHTENRTGPPRGTGPEMAGEPADPPESDGTETSEGSDHVHVGGTRPQNHIWKNKTLILLKNLI